MSVFILNPIGSGATMRRRINKGTSAGVKASWKTRKRLYGESGDSHAVKILHEMGITGLGIRRARGTMRSKKIAIARRRRGLPAYWKRLLEPTRKPRRQPTAARRKNAYFGNKEKHSRNAKIKWSSPHWPNIMLYNLIKAHGVLGGQKEYARYLKERGIELSRRRGGGRRGKPAVSGKESGMARRRKRHNPRGRRRRSALALLAPRRRRRRVAVKQSKRRHNALRENIRRRRRRNPPILWTANPQRRRRRNAKRKMRRPRLNAPILMRMNRRRRGKGGHRRHNAPILWIPNKGRKRRMASRFVRRHNPDILEQLKQAIPTIDDVVNALTITGFGLMQELFAYKLFKAVGLEKAYQTVPYIDQAVFTLLGTMGAAVAGGKRWAQLVMYGGLSTILRNVLLWKVIVPGTAGEFLKNTAAEIGYKPMSDYVTYGDRKPIPGGRWGPVSDFVTFGCETEEESAAAIEGGSDSFTAVEPGSADLADYYGVTAF